MKLYTRPGSARAQAILVTAQLAGKSVQVDTKSDASGKAAASYLPLLETTEGCLFESNAIMKYLASGNEALCGSGAFGEAGVNSWLDFCSNQISIQATLVVGPIVGWTKNDPTVTKAAMTHLMEKLSILNTQLVSNTFVAGTKSMSLADIALAAALLLPFKLALGDKERKKNPAVMRWFTTCVNQEAFHKVVGPVTLPKNAVKASAAAAAPAPAAAPAAPKKEEKKEEPKLSILDEYKKAPAGWMDVWKRHYSNPEDKENYYTQMPWFWENLDTKGYSVFLSKYKYNDENKVDYLTSNLCTGFLQRTDQIRKHAFGSLVIVGQNGGPIEVHGAWVFKGQTPEAILECNPDAEYHEWIKVENPDDQVKKDIADMWCMMEGQIYGKTLMDSKLFK